MKAQLHKVLIVFVLSIVFGLNINAQVGGFPTCADFFSSCGSDILEQFGNKRSCAQWLGSNTEQGLVYRNGGVGLGTGLFWNGVPSFCVPTGFLLSVEEGIATDEIHIELCSSNTTRWCDYVFDVDYKLPHLSEVNSFIEANKHLPGVPSASEIKAEKGIDIGRTKVFQQEKIEEIFLYLIELNNKITSMEQKVLERKKRLTQLRNNL